MFEERVLHALDSDCEPASVRGPDTRQRTRWSSQKALREPAEVGFLDADRWCVLIDGSRPSRVVNQAGTREFVGREQRRPKPSRSTQGRLGHGPGAMYLSSDDGEEVRVVVEIARLGRHGCEWGFEAS